jgi:3-dehydroquinate synthase
MPLFTPSPITVALPHGRAYPVHFARLGALPGLLTEAGLGPGRALVVTDANVAPLYLGAVVGPLTAAGWMPEARVVPAGEPSKSLNTLAALYDWALGLGIERRTPLLALGGGVVGDLAGFAAATLLRGLPLVHLSTTVVAQVDSAIGGKTGVNHALGKNLIGAFYQPRFVLADPTTLDTLPDREYRAGLAEVFKAALVADADFFHWLEENWDRIVAREPEAVAMFTRRAAAIKASIVAGDEREHGRRAVLNFGHTFGHAIERAAGYGRFLHGEAVATGMRAALHLSPSVAHGAALPPDRLPEPFARADRLVARLPLAPLDGLSGTAIAAAMEVDKKREGARLRFVVLDDLGRARTTEVLPPGAVEAAWVRAAGGGLHAGSP